MKNILFKFSHLSSILLVLAFGGTYLKAQTFPSPGFTLPAGKTIVITYEVDVNANACPTGTVPGANLSNQSNVSGSNFATVQTDDPDIAGSSNPTLTPFSALTIGNQVYKDVNRNGVFDSGTDQGVNGVLMRLYLDDGDGVLTASDGAAIATTTTTGGGLYSFIVCPGSYIVEVASSNFNPGGALYDNGLMAALVSSPVGGAPDPDNDIDNDDNGDPVAGFGVAASAVTVDYGTEPVNDGDTDSNTNQTVDFGFKTPTTVSIGDVTMSEGTGGSTTAFNFTVTRNDNSEAFSLVVNTNDGTAVNTSDYTAISGGTVSFTAGGSLTATVTVLVNQDNIVENNETFTVLLSGAPGGVTISDGLGLGTINNDDAAVVTLTAPASQLEGNAGNTSYVFTLTLDNPVQGGFMITANLNPGTATFVDFDLGGPNTTFTFAGTAGETQTMPVTIHGDTKVELDETFSVSLDPPTGAPSGVTTAGSPLTGTITNDDAATVSIAANVSQAENITPQVFSVTLSNPVDVPVTVAFSTSDGTAMTSDNDYAGIAGQTVTFATNTTTSQTVSVTVINDNKVEPDEVFNVAIGTLNASGRNVSLGTSTGTGTIVNDDAAVVTLTGGGSAAEGNSGATPRIFTATLNNPVQGGFSVAYTTNDGTATIADNDYVDNDASLSFTGTSSEAKTITVQVNGDLNIEADETFTVALGAISGAPAGVTTAGSPQTGTILNDEKDWGDAPTAAQSGFASSYPTLSSNSGANHNEAPGGLHLGATVDGDADGQPNATATGDGADEDGVTIPLLVTGTTANITVNASGAGKLDGWVDFNKDGDWLDAGEQVLTSANVVAGNNTLSFPVPAGALTGNTFARFRLSSGGGLAPTGAATDGEVEDYQVSISSISLSINDVTSSEGNAGTTNFNFTVSLNNPAGPGGVTFDISTADNTATTGDNDYVLNSLISQTIPAGSTTYTFTVAVNGDLKVENNETFFVNVTNVVGAGVTDGQGQGTINNDDSATLTLSGGISQNEGNSGATAYTFTATLNNAVQGGFVATYSTNDGTATTADNDYQDNDGSLSFAGIAGEVKSFTVLVNGDTKVELNETFNTAIGTLSGNSGVILAAISPAGSPQTATIVNDDAATVAIAGNVSQSENITPQNFTVTLSNPVDVPVSVQFSTSNGTATTADNDYSGIAGQTVTFSAGATTAQTVPVTIINDNKVEADETFNVAIGSLSASGRNVSLGTSSAVGTIQNDDSATVTLSGGISQNEGNSGATPYVFTVTVNNPVQGGFSVNYVTNDGTATVANNDYQDNDGSLSFSGTSGESHTFTVLVNGDLNIEANETFQTAITSLSGLVNAPAVSIAGSPQTATIINDEQDWGDAPTAAQSGFAGTYPTLAADNGASHALAVGGLHLGATVDADLDGQPNSAATGDGADEDGVTLPGALVLNTSANITVNASGAGKLDAWVDFNRDGDWQDPGEQIFTNLAVVAGNNALSFAVPAGASIGNSFARFRISSTGGLAPGGAATDGEVEDYAVNIVNTQFSINDPSVNEGNSGTTNLTFTITRTNNASACSVDYAITGGTATTADNDYQTLAAGTANFTAGGSLTFTFNVIVNGDVKVELNETVDVTLSNPVNGSILDGSGTGTIVNDDAAIITVSNPTVTEGDTGSNTNATFNITMSNPSDANVVVNYATVDGSATIANNDYQSTSGTHTFTPGQTSKTVVVVVNGDCSIEPNETFLLRLSGLSNNGRNISLNGGGSTLDGTGTINNDDALPVITCPANLSRNVDPGVCTTTVTLPLPTLSSICGSSTLDFRYRLVDALGNPLGSFTAYFLSANNSVSFTTGRYEVEWRVTDGSGASSCSFYVTIIDNQPPTIVCPANQTLSAGANCSTPLGVWNPVSVSDNCTPVGQLVISQSPGSSYLLVGHNSTITVVLGAKDLSGNGSSCSFSVTLKDVTPPVAKCKNATINIPSNGIATVATALIDNGSADNCSFTLSVNPGSFLCNQLGVHQVTLTATDVAGNTATCTAQVTIQDLTPPTALCKNPTIFLDNTGHVTLTPPQVDNGSSDACGISNRTIDRSSFNCSEIGSAQIVVLTVTDSHGNTATCQSFVTVKDNTAPNAVCDDVTVQLGSNGKVTVYGADLAELSTDNCSVWSYSPIAKVYTTANLGVNNLSITVKDWSNNASTCVSQVTVTPFNNNNNIQAPGAPGTGSGAEDENYAFILYPNPSELSTGRIVAAFNLPEDQSFQIKMFDLQGRMVYFQQNSGLKGENTLPVELSSLSGGVYLVEFRSGDFSAAKKLIIRE